MVLNFGLRRSKGKQQGKKLPRVLQICDSLSKSTNFDSYLKIFNELLVRVSLKTYFFVTVDCRKILLLDFTKYSSKDYINITITNLLHDFS